MLVDSGPSSAARSSRLGPYPEYKDSGVEWLGEIPAHWDVAALRYRYEQTLGKMLDAKQITGDHLVPYLRNVDVQWDHINVRDLPKMDIRPQEIERFTVRPGDLLVCEGGETGRCAIWQGNIDPCGYQKALHRLRPLDQVRDNPRFLYYTFAAAVTGGAFADGQGSTIGHLTGDMLRAHRFPFPQPAEQSAIADFLDRETAKIDRLVARQERLIEVLREKRTALISHAVTRGLDPNVTMKDSGVDWLGEIPVGWDSRPLKYLAVFMGGGTPSKNDPEYWSGDIPWVSPKDMRSRVVTDTIDHITPEAVNGSATRLLDEGAVLVVVRSGILRHTIPVAIAGRQVALNQDLKAVVSLGSISPRYLMYFIEGMEEALLVEWRKEGATVESLETERMALTQVPVPPTPEQRAITEFLDSEVAKTDALITKVRQTTHSLNELRAALISGAVAGTIDVREVSV